MIESGTYVDKTEILFDLLAKRGAEKYFTLSRPDGFGKTILLDTIEALFKGEKELFKGLYIEDKWNFEDTYPVLRLNMKELTEKDVDGNEKILMGRLGEYAEQYELTDKDLYPARSPSSLYGNLVEEIHRKTGKKVVVLIDDYDAPFLINIHNADGEKIYDMAYRMYSRSKPLGDHIKFFFMTGITLHTPNTIFSGFNNAKDISNHYRYPAICGFTDEEIDKYFTPFFEKHFSENGISSDEEKTAFRNRVREYYGGYRFTTRNSVTLYNPKSVGKFVESGCVFANYWKDAGVQPLVKELIKVNAERLKGEKEFETLDRLITVFDVQELIQEKARSFVFYSFLRQTGWLSPYNEDSGFATLRYPNREVEETMAEIIGEA